ncbi:claudin-15-like [Pelmatolapia mariae]|uniref:claudin-15-like n=1 Tax=Pelmatolapia mariae TaxID=158779 RepID=UPI003211DFB2
MSTAVEAVGFIMCIISWLVNGAALVNDYWKVSTFSSGTVISQRHSENLWHACVENSAGIAKCRDFESLALPIHVQACRALMIICLLLGLGSMIVALLGLKCIKIGSNTDQSKAKIATIGGILSFLAGLCCMIAASWYAAEVIKDFNDPFHGGLKFELGTGLYIGWTGAILAMLGGAFLCSPCKRASVKKGGYYGNAPQKVYKQGWTGMKNE